ncbi:MAG: NAD(P)H-dependent oxidoreductase [Cyanobacteria bacterium]|nr:NAD(P)H-dependent oxidoreductase [Cyanobacteriota bacterium]
MMIQVLVVHHSMMGHTAVAAERLAAGGRSIADVHCISKPVLADGISAENAATREDFRNIDALVLGSPVHQRGVSWEMKRFIDLHCEPSWFWDDMVGRVGGVFTTGGGHGGAGGGGELAQLGLLSNLASMGMILVSHPKTTPGFDVAGMHWGPQVRTGGLKLEPDEPNHMNPQALDALFHYGAAISRVTMALKLGANGKQLMPVGNISPSLKDREGRQKQDGTQPIGEPR